MHQKKKIGFLQIKSLKSEIGVLKQMKLLQNRSLKVKYTSKFMQISRKSSQK